MSRTPPRFQRLAWPVLNAPGDLLDHLPGRRDGIVPTGRQLRAGFIGGADFKEVGREFFRYFVDLGGLRPGHRVLDVGCGYGRMAVPLTRYLHPSGSYEGIDIVADSIAWCTDRITARHPNFRFRVADVRNSLYNPAGSMEGSQYRFPFDTASFDFVFLTSVFTHMLPDEAAHYLAEIARVLKSGAPCLMSWFLLNDDARAGIARGASILPFLESGMGYWTTDREHPERAVAYDEDLVRRWLENNGLTVVEPVHYGFWPGRSRYLSCQDVVVVRNAERAGVGPDGQAGAPMRG